MRIGRSLASHLPNFLRRNSSQKDKKLATSKLLKIYMLHTSGKSSSGRSLMEFSTQTRTGNKKGARRSRLKPWVTFMQRKWLLVIANLTLRTYVCSKMTRNLLLRWKSMSSLAKCYRSKSTRKDFHYCKLRACKSLTHTKSSRIGKKDGRKS